MAKTEDFPEPPSAQELYDDGVARDLSVDVLVNNAGYGLFSWIDTQKAQGLVRVLVCPCALYSWFSTIRMLVQRVNINKTLESSKKTLLTGVRDARKTLRQ